MRIVESQLIKREEIVHFHEVGLQGMVQVDNVGMYVGRIIKKRFKDRGNVEFESIY